MAKARKKGKKGKSRKSILKTLRLIENNDKLLQKYKEELGKQIVFLYLCDMKELLKYLVIRCTTRHAKTALEVYNTLYPKQTEVIYVEKPVYTQVENSMSVTSVPVKNKKDELLESLNYLKSKKVKTKQDKESIYSLEMVLKNMK